MSSCTYALLINTAVIVNTVNTYRDMHCAPNISWDSKLGNIAQSWAVSLACSDQFFHSDNSYGENLALIHDPGNSEDKTWAVIEALRMFYNEYNHYDYSKPSYGKDTGHFTQLVWANSQRIGVGVAKNSYNQLVVVMNFDPAGNYAGQFSQNVFHLCIYDPFFTSPLPQPSTVLPLPPVMLPPPPLAKSLSPPIYKSPYHRTKPPCRRRKYPVKKGL